MPRKVIKRGRDEPPPQDDVNSRAVALQNNSVQTALSPTDVPPSTKEPSTTVLAVPSVVPAAIPSSGNAVLDATLLRTQACLEQWIALYVASAQDSYTLLTGVLRSSESNLTNATSDAALEEGESGGKEDQQDAAKTQEANILDRLVRLLATRTVGTVEVLFNDGREALLTEFTGGGSSSATSSSPVTATLQPKGAAEDATGGGRGEGAAVSSMSSRGGTGTSSAGSWRRTFFPGDVIAFVPKTTAAAGGSLTLQASGNSTNGYDGDESAIWLAYQPQRLQDESDRFDAMDQVYRDWVFPSALGLYAAKPGMAQLVAFYRCETSREWARLLAFGEGVLPFSVYASERQVSTLASSPTAARERLSEATAIVALLVGQALHSAYTYCDGMTRPLTKWTLEFVGSPLFLAAALHVVQRSSGVVRNSGGGGGAATAASRSGLDDDQRRLHREWCQILSFVSDVVWTGFAWRHRFPAWKAASVALGAVYHAASISAQTATTAADGRDVLMQLFYSSFRRFAAWISCSSARGTSFAPNTSRSAVSSSASIPSAASSANSSSTVLLDHFLRPPTLAHLLRGEVSPSSAAASSSNHFRREEMASVAPGANREKLLQLFHLPPLGQAQALDFHMWFPSLVAPASGATTTATETTAATLRLATIWEVYSELYSPIAKALRSEIAERRARREAPEYDNLTVDVLSWCVESSVSVWHDHDLNPHVSGEAGGQQVLSHLLELYHGIQLIRSIPLVLTFSRSRRGDSDMGEEGGKLPMPWEQLRHDPSQRRSLLGALVLEMSDDSEPLVFSVVIYPHGIPLATAAEAAGTEPLPFDDGGHAGDTFSCLVHLLEGGDMVASLLETITEAHHLFRQEYEEHGDKSGKDNEGQDAEYDVTGRRPSFLPQARLVLATELSSSAEERSNLAQRDAGAVHMLSYLHHLVMQHEGFELARQVVALGGSSSSSSTSSSSAVDAAGNTAASPTDTVNASGSVLDAVCSGQPLCSVIPRHISPAERESLRKAAIRVAAALGTFAPCVSRPGIAECLGSVAAGGPTGIHTVEGVCGSGKTLSAVLAAAAHGICRSEGREEQQRDGVSSLLEHVSAKVVTTQQHLVSQLQSSSSRLQHPQTSASSVSSSSSFNQRSRSTAASLDIIPMLDARTQQEEEYARYRRQLVIRSPVLALEESRASGSVETLCRILQAQGLLKLGTSDALLSKGRQRSLRSPLRNMLVSEYIRCVRMRNVVAFMDKFSENDRSEESDRDSDDDNGGAKEQRYDAGGRVESFVVPWVAAAALRSLSRNGEAFLRWCCGGSVDVSDALRVALGSHGVLMYGGAVHNALRQRRPRQHAARAAAAGTPPTVLPSRYRMSSTSSSTLARLVADFESSSSSLQQQQQQRQAANSLRSTAMWLSSHHHSCLLDLQRQTLRGALHRLESEAADHIAFLSELIDYVAAFEAQSCDVLCSTDTALLRDISLYRCGLDARGACRGALPATTALVVDGVESMLHAPWLTLRSPTYFFSTHSLERLTTAEMRCGWGVSAVMDGLIRAPKSAATTAGGSSGAILSLPATPVTSVAPPPPPPQYPTAVSQLKECLRFTSEFTTNATCMMLPPPILRNTSTLLPRMAPDVSERIISAWWTSVVLWSPTHVTSFARRDAAALMNAATERDAEEANPTGGNGVAAGGGPPGATATASSAVDLFGGDDAELWLALQLAEELAAATGGRRGRPAVSGDNIDFAEDISATDGGDLSPKGLRVAVLVPSVLHKAVLRVQQLSTTITTISSRGVTFGDLFTLRGRVFDAVVIAPLGTPKDALWLWRAATRCRLGFAVVSSPKSSNLVSKSEAFVGLPSFNPLSLLKTFLHDALVHGRDRQVAKGMVSDVVLHAAGATVGGASSRDVQIDVAVQQRKNHFDVVRFRCPTHAQSVYAMLASMSAAAPSTGHGGRRAGKVEVRVEREGVTQCGWICLGRYRFCEHPAHRCVRSCHVRVAAHSRDDCCAYNEEGNEDDDDDDPHAHCPFPCPRTLPCGHRCMATCGEHECPPCGFVGLAELTCGQAVIGGMSGKDVQYVLQHHFQLVGCGHEPQPCSETVTLPCRQCGGKVTGTCSDAVNSSSWPCSICESILAKVRKDFQLEPSSATASSISDDNNNNNSSATMPDADGPKVGEGPKISDWPVAAREALEKQLSFMRQKHSLLDKRMALNMAANGTHKNPEFEAESQRVTRQRLEAERLEEAWKQRSSDAKAIWAQRMVAKVETQQEWNRFADAQLKKLVDRLLMTD